MNMELTKTEIKNLIDEIALELKAKPDGSRKNLIVPVCPFCGNNKGKYGIYIGPDTSTKQRFMSHCFKCQYTTVTLNDLLDAIDRPDLKIEETTDLNTELSPDMLFKIDDEEEMDVSLLKCELPDDYRRTFNNPYLQSRGFTIDDYETFPVGTTRGCNFKFNDYVIFPIIDNGEVVNYVSRHIWGKKEIDAYNKKAKIDGKYQILRYRNSTTNDFIKVLYNYDAIITDVTSTVIIVEGIFDVIGLYRTLSLYDNDDFIPVATFGKKISQDQIFKIQSKGVETVIIGYDSDAVEAIQNAIKRLTPYFNVMVAHIPSENGAKDFGEMEYWDVYDILSYNLLDAVEYNLKAI